MFAGRRETMPCHPPAFWHGEDGQGREPGHDQEELQDLIINSAGEAAHIGVNEYDGRDGQHRRAEIPTQHQVQQQAHGVHGDAGGEDGHHGEGEGVEAAGLLIEAQLEVFGDGTGLAAVIKRHHEDAHEEHGGNGADPIEVGRHDAILGAGSRHADEFLRAEIGRDEGEAGDPDRDGAPGEQKVATGRDFLTQHPTDADHKGEVRGQYDVVDGSEVHRDFRLRTPESIIGRSRC